MAMRFGKMTPEQRAHAERLLAEYLTRPRNAGVRPGDRRFYYLCAGAATVARHGPPPTRNQRLGYRTAKRNRARAAARLLYGDPAAPVPIPGAGALPSRNPPRPKRQRARRSPSSSS